MKALDPEAVAALYAETPDRFVAARNELAARLKDAGDPDAAKQVTALRRPTVAAWAVDHLARDYARELDALIDVGRHLASAQRGTAVGGDADRLRETAGERRRLVDRLVRASAKALEDAGLSATRATLDKVTDTLMAIATDQEAAEKVRGGVIDKEVPAPAGFGDERLDAALLASVSELPRRPSTRGGSRGASPTAQQQRKEVERARRADRSAAEALKLEEEADRLEREAKEADAKAVSAGRTAAAARRRADAARRRADAG
jgi:hypothetical protein